MTRTPSLLNTYRKLTSAQRALAVQEGMTRWHRERVIELQAQVRAMEEAAKKDQTQAYARRTIHRPFEEEEHP